MNQIIFAVKEAGLSQAAYLGFFTAGFITVLVFYLRYAQKIQIRKSQAVYCLVLGSGMVLTVMGLLQQLLKPLETYIPIMNSYLNNMGRSFVFVPLIASAAAAVLKLPRTKVANLYAFSQTILWAIASLGCLFAGCCKGYPWGWGIYNPVRQIRLFPTQVLNAAGLLSIAWYLYRRCEKRKFVPDGKEYPIVLILVGILRFSTEFLMDNRKIILGLSSLSFDALVMCSVGLILLHRRKRRNTGTEID